MTRTNRPRIVGVRIADMDAFMDWVYSYECPRDDYAYDLIGDDPEAFARWCVAQGERALPGCVMTYEWRED